MARVQPLVGELRPQKLCGTAKKKNKKETKERKKEKKRKERKAINYFRNRPRLANNSSSNNNTINQGQRRPPTEGKRTQWPPVTASPESAGGAPAQQLRQLFLSPLHPLPRLLSAAVSLPAGFLPPGLSHPVDVSLRVLEQLALGTCCSKASSCLCPASKPAFLPVRELPSSEATVGPPGLNLVPSSGMWAPAGMVPQHGKKQGAFMACGSDSKQERKEKRGRRNSVVVAQFLEIQRKMLPRHLRLKVTKTKVLVFTSSRMGFSSPIQPSSSPSKPWNQLVPRSEQFCLRNVSLPSLCICTPRLSL